MKKTLEIWGSQEWQADHKIEELWDWICSNIGFDKKEILDGIRELVSLKIAEREHDHENLVNTINADKSMKKWQERLKKSYTFLTAALTRTEYRLLEQFISGLLAERYHDHKILVNSILDIKNKELKERDKEWLDFVVKERDKIAKNANEFNKLEDDYEQGYWMAMNTIIKQIEKLRH